jgi:hypothetical protein
VRADQLALDHTGRRLNRRTNRAPAVSSERRQCSPPWWTLTTRPSISGKPPTNLRANSHLNPAQYGLPVLGLIFRQPWRSQDPPLPDPPH